jgi:2-keto-4-pentenoate hydratase
MGRLPALAATLERAHRERRPVSLPPDLTGDEAYSLQEMVFAALAGGGRPIAWKVGSAGPEIEPIMAPVLPGRLFASPAHIAAERLRMSGVEIEIAFRMGEGGQAAEALVAIELCDTRLADWDSASAAAKLADFQSNSALVAGSGTARWRDIEFGRQRAELWIDGRLAKQVAGAHPHGNPARLLPWAVAHCARRGGLQPGDLVTTGSWTGMHFVAAGCELRAVFPGVGEAVVKLKD